MLNTATKKKLGALWSWIAKPPYYGLPWLIWFYAVFAFFIVPFGGVWTGHLFGFDDHVRMTQVLDWVNGAGWYDRTIMRANAPEGFHTIWTRIVDIPIATVVVLAQQFVDQRTAALVASVVVPFAELLLLMVVAGPYFARPLVGKTRARLIVLFLMFTSVMNHKFFSISGFFPGEASHHSWYVILDIVLFGAAARMALGGYRRQTILMMSGSIALLLAVGIEGFPMIAGACAILAGIAWYFNRPLLAQAGAKGMGGGALMALVLLPMNQPPAHFFDILFGEPSILGPILIGSAALFMVIEKFILQSVRHKKTSLILLLVIAGIIGAFLLSAFPQMRDGPAAALSPAERAMAMREHYEAYSLFKVSSNTLDFIGLVAPTVIALIAGFFALRSQGMTVRRRAVSLAYVGFTALGGFMVEMFSRFNHHALTTACPWLLWAWNKIRDQFAKNRHYSLAAFGVYIAIAPFWMFLLPAMQNNVPFLTQVLLYPARMQTMQDPCDTLNLANYINAHYSKDATLIVPNWDTSRFLYQTDVRISFVANYPSHDQFIDNENFFDTRDLDVAKDIAVRHHLDLVAVCRGPARFDQRFPIGQQMLMGLLQVKMPPPWLKLLDLDQEAPGNYLLYEIDHAVLNGKKGK